MSDFKAKMHKIRFPLVFRPPQTPLGELAAYLRSLLIKGGRGKGEGEKEGWKGRGRRDRPPNILA